MYQFENKDGYIYLKLITDEELKELMDFLNSDKLLCLLVKILRRYQKENDISECNLVFDLTEAAKKAKIRKGNENYSKKTIGNKFTGLNKSILEFITLRVFRQKKTLQNQLLIEQLLRRGKKSDTLSIITKKTKQRIEEDLEIVNTNPQNEFTYENKFKLYLFDYVLDVQSEKSHREKETNLQNAYDQIEYDYWLKKIKYVFVMLNREQIVNIKYEFKNFKFLLTYLQQQELSEHPLIYLYYNILRLYLEAYQISFDENGQSVKNDILNFNDDLFNFILNYLNENAKKITGNEQLQIYTALSNICVKLERLGKIEYTQKRKEVYESLINNEVILVQGRISGNHFSNIISIGTTLKDKEWVIRCKERFESKLSKQVSIEVMAYNNTLIYFMDNKLEEAEMELSKISDDIDFVYNLNVRTLRAKIYYERIEALKTYQAISKAINHFLPFLRRFIDYLKDDKNRKNTIVHEERRNAHKAFVETIIKMLNDIQEEKFIRGSVLEKIETSKLIVEKRWLLTKCENLSSI
ncbi:MAG: hypothetical protein AB8G11_12735 [Saprospiraceae bacterium]